MIDTLGIAKELAEAGVFTREQADRQAKVMAKVVTEKHDSLATKEDIQLVKDDIQRLEKSLEKSAGTTRWLISLSLSMNAVAIAGILAILIVLAW